MTSLLSSIADSSLARQPVASRHAARRLLLDQLGISCAGRTYVGTHPTLALAARMSGSPKATIWSDGSTALAPYAALANRAVGDELELCAGPECVAAAVAAAEMVDASLGELLDALTVSADIDEYVRGWLGEAVERHGLHPPALFGALSSAAAAGRLLGLSSDQLAGSLGAAASLAPQSSYAAFSHGASGKTLYGAWSQMLGLWMAMWAESGTSGPHSTLDGARGVAQAMHDAGGIVAPPSFKPDGTAITRVAFKPYPCNRACHAALTALERLPSLVEPDDIRSIDVLTYPYAVDLDRRSHGNSPIAAQLSIGTTVALWLVLGSLEPGRAFTAANLADPRIASLARRTTVGVLPGSNRSGTRVRVARVTLTLGNGTSIDSDAEAKWSVSQPATDEELRTRYDRFTSGTRGIDPWQADDASPVRHLVARSPEA